MILKFLLILTQSENHHSSQFWHLPISWFRIFTIYTRSSSSSTSSFSVLSFSLSSGIFKFNLTFLVVFIRSFLKNTVLFYFLYWVMKFFFSLPCIAHLKFISCNCNNVISIVDFIITVRPSFFVPSNQLDHTTIDGKQQRNGDKCSETFKTNVFMTTTNKRILFSGLDLLYFTKCSSQRKNGMYPISFAEPIEFVGT